MPDLFKEVIPAIMNTKKQVFQNDEEADEYYIKNGYMVNKTLSMYLDCIFPANMINYFWSLDGKMKHDFFLSVIRGYRRSFNYAKAKKTESDLKSVSEYYECSYAKAKEYLSVLDDEQIAIIRKKLEKGGNLK